MADEYTQKTWQTGEAITAQDMNHMETGIYNAQHTANQAADTASVASGLNGRVSTLETTVGTTVTAGLQGRVSQIEHTLDSNNSDGPIAIANNALAQIAGATTNHDPAYDNLDTRFDTDEGKIKDNKDALDALQGIVEGAYIRTGSDGRVTDRFDSLVARLDNTDQNAALYRGYVNTLRTDYANAKGNEYASLNERLSYDESQFDNLQADVVDARVNGSLSNHFSVIETEIRDARKSRAKGNVSAEIEYGSLDARFEAIEGEIVAARSTKTDLATRIGDVETEVVNARENRSSLNERITYIENNKMDKSARVNTLSETREGFVLDARQGRELDISKVNYDDVKDNLTSSDSNKPLSAKQGKALKDMIGDGFDSSHTIAARIDAIDNGSSGTVHGLDTRLTTVENDLNTDVTGLKARVSAIDNSSNGAIKQVNDKIETIANELVMMDNGTLVTTNTRVDTLEQDLRTMAAELDMLDGTSIVDTNTRVDDLASRMNAVDNASTGSVALLGNRVTALETTINTNDSGLTARVGTLESNNTNLTTRVGTLESTVNDTTNGLAATKAIADAAKAKADTALQPADITNLTNRVTTLEGKDTIIVDNATFDNEGKPQIQNPSQDCDYLIKGEDDKYFYWRYLGSTTGWQLISGAGGGGTGSSSGMFISSLDVFEGANALTPDENIDYFVGDNTVGYTHYRYLIPEGFNVGSFVRILPKGLLLNASVNANGGLVAGTVENPNTNVFNNFVALKSVDSEIVTDTNGNAAGTKITFMDTNGTSYPITVQGGGSGGGTAYSVKLNNETGALQLTVPDIEGNVTNLQARAVVKEGAEIATNLGSALTVTTQYSASTNGPWNTLDTRTVNNNESFQVNVTNILRTGIKMYIRMTLTTSLDGQAYSRPINFEVTKVEMSITAINFNPATVRTGNLVFQYRCIGDNLEKVVHFKIDGTDAVTPVTTSSHNEPLQQAISLTGKSTGMHSFEVYFTVNGVSSNILNYYILYNPNTANELPMFALAAEKATITYGDELKINYTTAVNPNVETMDSVHLELYTVDNDVETIITDTNLTNVRNEEVHPWIPVEYPLQGTAYIRGTASRTVNGTTYTDTRTIQVTINELVTSYDLSYAGTDNLLYSYTAYGRTNNDLGKEQYNYTYTSHDTGNPQIIWTGAFNNFNWSTDGYVDGESLTIGGGATHTIDLPIFESKKNNISLEVDSNTYNDPTQNGRTIEIEYEVQSATDLNDTIIDCMDNNHVGFRITPQSCYLLNNNVNISFAADGTGTILNEDSIAAAYLTTGVRTHLTFVIEPWAETKAYDRKYHQSVNIYINGEFANACPYNRDNSTGNISDSFKTNATMRIGSASCIIKLYSVKMYNRGLTHTEVLQNYKMAPGKTLDKLVRFDKNNLIRGGKVNYELARKQFNCLLLVGPEPVIRQNEQGQDYNAMPTISPYKGSPSPIGRTKDNEIVGKTESGLILTYPDGSIEGYKTEFDLRDIMADGGYASSNNVQGTSSQKYPIHNLKIYLMKGTEGQEELDEHNEPTGRYLKSEKVKYKLPGTKGKGESTLCWKADYMSTDHANTYNANIADSLFTDSLNPDITNEAWQSGVQNTVHGIRCLLFKQEGTNAPEFVADGCLNNDKGNSKTYGLEYSGDNYADTTAQKWEFTNNSDDLGFFKYDSVFYPTGNDHHYRALDAFESCFPDQGDLEDAQDEYKAANNNAEDPNRNPNYNHLQVLLTWVSQRANYWEETDPTVRAQKQEIFRTEFTKHFNLDHVLVYYLFSEYTALCDNRVKNMFMRSDTIRNERIKLLNGTVVFEGNNNPNADYWKSFTDILTNEVDQQVIINTIAAVYFQVHNLEEVEIPSYAETVAAQAAADAAASTLTLAQLQARIVSYLNNEEAAVGAGYMSASEGKEYVIEHKMSHADAIDWEEGEEHSQFARWAPVLYDLDSCFGVENVGLLKIPYNADWQYYSEGQYRFNGHDSIFWLMVEDTFKTELAAKALTLYNRSRGLNYNTFYQEQIVDNNNETAPAMTNQDMLLKFDAPWATGFMNYGNKPPTYETPEYKYLQRGTRAAQKTSFLFKRSMLLSSKYQADAFKNDKISFRYGADLSANQAVIECSANQIMYPAVSFGDNKGWTQALELTNGTLVVDGLVNAGETCRIRATSSAKGQDTLFIAGASVLTDIGDLSVFKPYELKVGQGKNLKRLIIGSNASGYTNAVTNTIENLSACSILEEINIRNCTAFTLLDVSANGLIKRIYAAGSGAGTISLPSGGVLQTIEYSAVTSNITILNHSSLTNFTFEVETGESAPTYSNLNKLWVENTPNVPIVDIINKRMGYLTNGVRLINIDVDLGNDATFLQTLASVLADGKYLDSTGSLNTNKTPEVTGKVHITEIRASLLAKINQMYPNLVVYNVIDNQGNASNNIIAEYTVEYQNYDGTTLYTDNRTNTENYIDPVFDTNPITGEPYIEMPTRPDDAQYKYKFGTYKNNKYQRYSGWVRRGTNTNPTSSMTVNGNTIFTAIYPTTEEQIYLVKWYDKYNGTVRKTKSVTYGFDLSGEPSPIDLGDMETTEISGNQVKVFNGWDRPLGKITHDTNVYALWQTSSINNNTQDIDMSTLTAADIYAISLLGNQEKAALLSDKLGVPIFIQMGQDFNYTSTEDVEVVNLLGAESELLFDGTIDDIRVYNNIKPLATNGDWTLAIDYKFLIENASRYAEAQEFVLASCYKNANSSINGFKVSLIRPGSQSDNPYIQVSWGTETVTIDYASVDNSNTTTRYFTSYRNVVVLSHKSSNQNQLRVSYVLPNTSSNTNAPNGANYGTFITTTTLTYNTNLLNTPLLLGGSYSGDTTNYEWNNQNGRGPASGIIYWAKFWNAYLGSDNCQKLAAWPHERVPFYLSGFNGTNENGNKNEQIYNNTELSFVAAQGMGDRYLFSATSAPDEDEQHYYGWHISTARNLCYEIIYKGMPEAYKSIIKQTTINSHVRDVGGSINGYISTNDYLFFPTYREITPEAGSLDTYGGEVNSSWTSPWQWMIPQNIQILEYRQGNTDYLVYKNPTNVNIYKYRFLGAYIKPTAKIFNITDDPASRNDLQIYGGGGTISVAEGDIWLNNGVAYMYFTNEQIERGVTVDELTSRGGWKQCDRWNLRTYSAGTPSVSENCFLYIKINGDTETSPVARGEERNQGRLLCPEFTV